MYAGAKDEHGMRLIALDPHTVKALRAHQERRRSRLGQWNDTLADDAYLFSVDEAGRHPVRRDTMGKRFGMPLLALGTATCWGCAHHGDSTWGGSVRLNRARAHGPWQLAGD